MSVYTVVVLSFVGAPVALAIDDVALHYALISTFIFFATTLTLCLVFIPKVGCSRSVTISGSGGSIQPGPPMNRAPMTTGPKG